MKDASKLVLFTIMAMSIVSLIISMPTLIVAILMGINYFALRALVVVILGIIIFSIAWVILDNQMDKELTEHKLKMEQLDKEFVERQQRVADRFKNLR